MVVPADAPVNIPEVVPIDATPVVPLTHVPPAGVVDMVVVIPVHTGDETVNDTGVGLTVNDAVE